VPAVWCRCLSTRLASDCDWIMSHLCSMRGNIGIARVWGGHGCGLVSPPPSWGQHTLCAQSCFSAFGKLNEKFETRDRSKSKLEKNSSQARVDTAWTGGNARKRDGRRSRGCAWGVFVAAAWGRFDKLGWPCGSSSSACRVPLSGQRVL
jgi:hypothetical protein